MVVKIIPVRGHVRRVNCTEKVILKAPPRREVEDEQLGQREEAPPAEDGVAEDEGEPEEA